LKKSKPESVGDILAGLLKKSGLGRQLKQAKIWEQWPEIAGKALHGHGRPYTVKDATLIIEADSPVWMNKFAYSKWEIIKRVNLLAGKELVSDVFFVLATDDDDPDAQDEK
jgi:predicted nucleic acid-binding Zn ribbon protein